MKKTQNKKHQKEISPKMKFNPGLQKYEPELPLKKIKKDTLIKINKKWILILLITIFIALIVLAIFL